MLYANNTRVRVIALIAFVVLLVGGAAMAHAQPVCFPAQLHPAGDITVIYTPFGPRTVILPCVHWVTRCN